MFVSILAIGPVSAETDEFAIFENEGNKDEKKISEAQKEPVKTLDQLKEEVRKQPQNMALIEELAGRLGGNKEYDKASKLLWKYIDKISVKSILLLSEYELELKNYDQAIRAGTLATGKSPKLASGYTTIGKAQKAKGLNAESLESFKSAISANPKLPDPYWELVKHYEAKNNHYEVRILLQDMVEAMGPKTEFLHRLCQVNYLDEAYEAAVQSCREAITKDPKFPDSQVYLGLGLVAVDKKDAALKILKKAADNFKNSELAQFHYAAHLQEDKNHIDAVKYFRSAVAADPASARSWLGLGTEAFELQRFDESLIALTKACRLKRFEAATQMRKNIIALRSQKNSAAIQRKFEQAAENCQFQ